MRLFLSIVVVGHLVAQQAPKIMTKLVVKLERPDVTPESFAAKPKLMYRAGHGYCRADEEPDTERDIHGLMIVNEPDVWMVNLFSRTARHFVDAGPTFNCRMPIFHDGQTVSGADTNNELSELEFGGEIAYFKGKGVISKEGPVLRGKPTIAYASDVSDSQLSLFTTGTPERPWAVARKHGNSTEIFWYGTYEELPFDPKLFARPENVRMEEAK